jgi:hypothetical protein
MLSEYSFVYLSGAMCPSHTQTAFYLAHLAMISVVWSTMSAYLAFVCRIRLPLHMARRRHYVDDFYNIACLLESICPSVSFSGYSLGTSYLCVWGVFLDTTYKSYASGSLLSSSRLSFRFLSAATFLRLLPQQTQRHLVLRGKYISHLLQYSFR